MNDPTRFTIRLPSAPVAAVRINARPAISVLLPDAQPLDVTIPTLRFEVRMPSPAPRAVALPCSTRPGPSAYAVAVAAGYEGTEAEWLESLKGIPGDPGLSAYEAAVAAGYAGTLAEWLEALKGASGADGSSAGLLYHYLTDTVFGDPGEGNLKFNSTNFPSVAAIYISKTTAESASVAGIIASWGNSTNAADRGTLTMIKEGDPSVVAVFAITTMLTNQTYYRAVMLWNQAQSGSFASGDLVRVFFTRTGNLGATGATGRPGGEAELYTYSTTTTDADPGNGILRLNATPASATTAYIDLLNYAGGDCTAWLDSIVASTSTNKAVLRLGSVGSNNLYHKYYITGVTTASGYRKLSLTYIGGAGTLSTAAGSLIVAIDRTGDKGDTGTNGTGLTWTALTLAQYTALADGPRLDAGIIYNIIPDA
jgi:hypothetical protein